MNLSRRKFFKTALVGALAATGVAKFLPEIVEAVKPKTDDAQIRGLCDICEQPYLWKTYSSSVTIDPNLGRLVQKKMDDMEQTMRDILSERLYG